MAAETALLTRSWPVGHRTCRMTVPRPKLGQGVHVAVEWVPDVPGRLTDAELRQYRAGRDAAIADVAQTLGLSVAVVDL